VPPSGGTAVFHSGRGHGGERSDRPCPPVRPPKSSRPRSRRIVRPNARRWRRNRRCVPAKRHLSFGRRSRFVGFELRTQCDRSAVGASGFRDPRVARLLAALARARPTAITSTAVANHPVSRGAKAVKRRRRESTRAHGVSRGSAGRNRSKPRKGRKRATAIAHSRSSFAPPGLDRTPPQYPRLAPWALALSRLRRLRMARGLETRRRLRMARGPETRRRLRMARGPETRRRFRMARGLETRRR